MFTNIMRPSILGWKGKHGAALNKSLIYVRVGRGAWRGPL